MRSKRDGFRLVINDLRISRNVYVRLGFSNSSEDFRCIPAICHDTLEELQEQMKIVTRSRKRVNTLKCLMVGEVGEQHPISEPPAEPDFLSLQCPLPRSRNIHHYTCKPVGFEPNRSYSNVFLSYTSLYVLRDL
jgi:hypothetical protein